MSERHGDAAGRVPLAVLATNFAPSAQYICSDGVGPANYVVEAPEFAAMLRRAAECDQLRAEVEKAARQRDKARAQRREARRIARKMADEWCPPAFVPAFTVGEPGCERSVSMILRLAALPDWLIAARRAGAKGAQGGVND